MDLTCLLAFVIDLKQSLKDMKMLLSMVGVCTMYM